MMADLSWITNKAGDSLYPAQVETTLIQLNEAWPLGGAPLRAILENFPLGEAALLHLLALSSPCAARIVRNPALLLWLSHPAICFEPRPRGHMADALERLAGENVAAENFRALRRWKNREMTRIALRALANFADLEETTADLSDRTSTRLNS